MTDPQADTPPQPPRFDHAACTCTHTNAYHDTTGCRAPTTNTFPAQECGCTATWK